MVHDGSSSSKGSIAPCKITKAFVGYSGKGERSSSGKSGGVDTFNEKDILQYLEVCSGLKGSLLSLFVKILPPL